MTALSNIAAIVQKEWRHYFGGPIAWVVMFVWTVFFGLFFFSNLTMFMEAAQKTMGQAGSINDRVIGPVFSNMIISALFCCPMLTMRLFAEEKRQGTIELLSTAPITDLQVVLGKFLAALALYAAMIAASLVNLGVLWMYASPAPEWRPIASATLALFLMGASYISMGTFLSTLTKNQMVAGILSFCLFLGLLILGWFDDQTASGLWKGILYLSVTTHMVDLVRGVIDLKDIVFYLSVIAFGIFISHQAVASERWRA
jgi:ABC-2 type transport system permease protein